MALVLDACYTIAIVLQEADVPELEAVVEQIAAEGAVVPSIWRYEIANVLLISSRRKRIAKGRPASVLASLSELPIRIDERSTDRTWNATFALAEKHQLTIYDAAYLELALRELASLASLDAALCAAAHLEKVTVIGS